MKSFKILAIVMALGLITFGIGFAEMAAEPGSADIAAHSEKADMAAPSEKADMAAHSEEADIAGQAALPDSIELTGTVLSDNTFVDDNGDNYQLAKSKKNEELLEHVGQRIKVTATVTESEKGMKNISVTDYKLLQE